MLPSHKIVFDHLNKLRTIAFSGPQTPAAKRLLLNSYFAAHPSTMTVQAEITPLLTERFIAEWVIAPTANPKDRLLYLHGGSWMAGSPCGYRPLAARLSAATQCAVLCLDYRLAPENPFPAGLDDCKAGYFWMCHHGPDGSKNEASHLFIAGDSAGGNLSLALCQVLCREDIIQPSAVAAFSPPTDLHFNYPSIQERKDRDPILVADALPLVAKFYLQNHDDLTHPFVSPIYADPKSWPPLLLQVGTEEVLLDDSRLLAEKISSGGGKCQLEIYEDMPHVFQGFAPLLPDAQKALEQVAIFFQAAMTE